MEVNKKTVLKHLNIVIDDKEEYLQKLRDQANEDGQSDEDGDFLSLTKDGHNLTPDECYFEEGSLHFSGNAISKEGSSFISFELPLSQDVLMDILGESIKKFNKIKTVFEATKD